MSAMACGQDRFAGRGRRWCRIPLLLLAVAAARADPAVVINEYINGVTTIGLPDLFELLVVADAADLRGMILKDYSVSGNSDNGGAYVFADHALWTSVRAGTLVLLRNDATASDTSAGGSDYVLDVGLKNTTYFANLGGTFDIASADLVQIKAAGSERVGHTGAIHTFGAFADGSGGQFANAPTPKLRATGSVAEARSVYALNSTSSVSDFNGTDAAFGSGAGSTYWTIRQPNTPANQAFIEWLRAGGSSLPTVRVATPDAVVPYTTLSADIEGVATNVVGVMAWSNALTRTGGSFPAATNWTVTGVALGLGANVITVTGTNEAGTAAADSVVLTRGGYQGNLPFVAAIEEDGSIYAASWSETNFAFGAATFVDDLRRNELACNSRSICAADFDGDGDVDLVAFRYGYTYRAPGYLLRNDGTNRFTLTDAIGLYGYCGDWVMDATAGDFDNDGHADVVVGGNQPGGAMGLFLGDGAGRFRRELFTWDMGAYNVDSTRGKDAADFDHDGNLDLAVARYNTGQVHVFFGLGNGLFGRTTYVGSNGNDPYGLAAGDFDGDGHPDIIVDSGSWGAPHLYRGNGDGTFQAGVLVSSLNFGYHGAFDAYDFDQDGDLDIVAVDHSSGQNLRFYRNNGNATFAPVEVVATGIGYSLSVTAPPLPPTPGTPTARLTAPLAFAAVGETITFDGSASGDDDGVLVSNRWEFGDGAATNLAGAAGAMTHAYASPGSYTVKLRVTDDLNWSAWGAARVTVTGTVPTPVASEIVLPETLAANGKWTFQPAVTQLVSGLGADMRTLLNPSVVIDEDFESGTPGRLLARSGTWTAQTNRVIDGAWSIEQPSASLLYGIAWIDVPIDGDYEFTFDAMLTGGSAYHIGIIDGLAEGWLALESHWAWMRGVSVLDFYIEQIGAPYCKPLLFTPVLNQVYHFRLVARRGWREYWIDGRYVGGVPTDNPFNGRVGIATYQSSAVFDNLRIRSLDSQPREGWVPERTEDFEDGDSRGWIFGEGNWSVYSNAPIAGVWSMRQSNTSVSRSRLIWNVQPTADFRFEADLRMLGGSGQEAILYLFSERDDYRYEVLFRGRGLNDLSVRRYNTGENFIFDRALPHALGLNTTYRIGVIREREWLRFTIGTNDLGRVWDPYVRVHMVTLGGYCTDLLYDNVRLAPLDAASYRPTYSVPRGTNDFLLTVAAADGVRTSATVRVVAQPGALPAADAGGPYVVNESAAQYNGWLVNLNGVGSSDAEGAIARYEWDLGADTFDGAALDEGKWLHSDNVTQNGMLRIAGDGYAYTRAAVTRSEGQAVEARVRSTTGDGIYFGFKQNNDGTAWGNWSYGFHSHNGMVYIVQDGGHQAMNIPWPDGVWVDLRVELKAGAGARFFWKRPGDAGWLPLYETRSGTAASFRRGFCTTGGVTMEIDDLREIYAGATPTVRVSGAGTNDVVLTVWDQALQTASATTTVARLGNAPPVASFGPDRTFGEAAAIDHVWTIAFSAAPSTDDFGIWTYEWDWDFDAAVGFRPSGTTGRDTSHSWSTTGTWHVALRVTDHAGQTNVVAGTVTTQRGTPPTAAPGGPYSVDEFSGNASAGAWSVALNGGASSDAESSLVQCVWDLGADTFDAPATLRDKWFASADARIAGGVLTFDWLAGNNDSGHHCFTRDAFARVRGLRAETRIRFPSTDVQILFGFKNNNESSTHWNQWVYGLHNHNGTLYYCEGGSEVSLGVPLLPNVWYDWRIELKAGSGARYYFKTAAATDWTLVRDSGYSSESFFRRGFHNYHGTFEAEHYIDYAAGVSPTYRFYPDHAGTTTVSLTVWDQVLQTNTATTPVACLYNEAPVARVTPGAYNLDESGAAAGFWRLGFDGSGSSDDKGLMRYEWDFSYDPEAGFQPNGFETVRPQVTFTAPGTYWVGLRVTDRVLQMSTVAVSRVTLSVGGPPTAVPAPGGSGATGVVAEVGWTAVFDGTGSSDDAAVARYAWEFGDGGVGSGPTPFHVFRNEGVYTARLRVFDGMENASAWATTLVAVVVGTSPTADAVGPYEAGAGGPPACFDGSQSADAGDPSVQQGIVKFLWDIDTASDTSGDGITDNDVDYTGRMPLHTYAAEGTYGVRLVVVDGAGQADTNDTSVSVLANLAPQVLCTVYRGDPENPHPVTTNRDAVLKGIARDAGTLTHQWIYGDGSSSTVQTVSSKTAIQATHRYAGAPGKSYTARLRVWDTAGLMGEATYPVVIQEDSTVVFSDYAVEEGLWWLHKDQNKTSGYWNSPHNGSSYASAGGSALLAFQVNGHRLDGNPALDPYVETIRLGFRDLFASRIGAVAISAQTYGNPDSNGNGIGIQVGEGNPIYQGGPVMDAFASSQAPLWIAETGPANVKGRSLLDIVTDMADCFAWGQNEGGGRGGWRYGWNYGSSDNSAAQWGAVGLLAAQDLFGIPIPAFVKSENRIWLNASYNTAGYFGYANTATEWNWYATSPSALVQLAMADETTTHAQWRVVERYIEERWPIESAASKLYYACYAFTKAMRLAKPKPVVNLWYNGLDWFDDPAVGLRQKVANQRDADGSWYAYAQQGNGYALGRTLSTAWAISMLTPSVFAPPPKAVVSAPKYWAYGLEFALTADRSYHTDPSRRIVAYEWDFDNDGSYDLTTTNAADRAAFRTVADPTPGVKDPAVKLIVRLRVTDDAHPPQSDVASAEILVGDAPFAPFAVPGGPYMGITNRPARVDGSASYDLDNYPHLTLGITRYQWDFDGDGGVDVDTNVPTAGWTYADPGVYQVGLRVWDDGVFNGGTNLASDWAYAQLTIYTNRPPVQQPDLQAVSLTVSGTREVGSPLTLGWRTANVGDAAAGAFQDRVRLRRTATGAEVLSQSVAQGGLSAGESRDRTLAFTPTLPGAYEWIVAVDNGQAVFEHDGLTHAGGEQNVFTHPFEIQPDLSGPGVSSFTADLTPVTNGLVVSHPVELCATVADSAGINRVEYRVNGALLALLTGAGPVFAADWDIELLDNGMHALELRAFDTLGNRTIISNDVVVMLAPPALAPTLTSPVEGSAFARTPVLVKGRLNGPARGAVVFANGATGTVATVSADGTFEVWLALADGTNEVRAAQNNRAGLGPLSPVLRLILDRSVPAAPSGLSAASREAGEIRLTWWQPAGSALAGWQVFRAAAPFSSTSAAVRVTAIPATAASWTDLPPSDGTWHYRVASVNYLGTWSGLSEAVQGVSDRTPPGAAIAYSTTGARVGDRFGPGTVTLGVALSEKPATTPFLSLARTNGTPIAVALTRQTDTLYRGQFTISAGFGTADLYAIFSARDVIGNRGTQVTAGGQIAADTEGPEALAAILAPAAPLANDPPGTNVHVALLFAPGDQPADMPLLSYTLSTTQPTQTPVALAPLAGTNYAGGFALPANAGSAPEQLDLRYRGVDALGNTGSVIRGWVPIQVYQGSLPPLPPPADLTAEADAGGRVELAWSAVPGAARYVLHRRAPGEEALKPLAGPSATAWSDTPPEGLNRYAVATVRCANGQTVTGVLSTAVSITTDATPPPVPQGLTLWGLPQGIALQWRTVGDSGAVHYTLYRDTQPVTNTALLAPRIENIVSTQALDTAPLPGDAYYAVTVTDASGNESAPSLAVYTNLALLPVRNLRVDLDRGGIPVLAWQHAAPAQIDGFRVELRGEGPAWQALHAGLLPASSNRLVDVGYDGTNRCFSITAVSIAGGATHPSLPREILLPAVAVTPATNRPISRGVMNRVVYRVANRSGQPLPNVRLGLTVAGHASWSDPFVLGATQVCEVAVVVGGHADLPDAVAGTNTLWIHSAADEDVYVRARHDVTVINDALSLTAIGHTFTRGADGQCAFELVNTAGETVEIVTAQSNGGADSADIRFQLEHVDGNVYATAPLRQATGTQVLTLSDGRSLVRLAPGASFLCEPVTLAVPSAVPDAAVLRVVIDRLHNGLGTDRAVSIQGLTARTSVSLIETAYFGTLTNVAPTAVMGTNPVRLAGQALRRADGMAESNVPVKLILSRSGFERTFTLYTGADGSWRYDFQAAMSESGRYTVHVIHPDSHERPAQGSFIVQRIWITPTTGQVTVPRGYEQSIWIDLGAGDGTIITNARVVYRPEDQPGGVLATGVTVTLPPSVDSVAGRTVRFPIALRGDATAAPSGELVLRVMSDGPAPGDWGTLRLSLTLLDPPPGAPGSSQVWPVLQWTPAFINTGVSVGDTVTANVELRNVGYGPMEDVRLALVATNGEAVPGWVVLNSGTNLGTLAVAAWRTVGLTFAPAAGTPAQINPPHEFRLRIWAANHATNEVPLFVAVDDAGKGDALFHVMDIYTGTLDGENQPIPGLPGARIELVREETGLPYTTNVTSDAVGEALVRALPEGRYRVRISARDHLDKTDRIWIRPGTTVAREYTLESPLVTVDWSVTESTIEDQYEIVLQATYQTDVPAAVVVIDPPSVTIPPMEAGEVFNGEFTVRNYGLIRAEEVSMPVTGSDEFYKFELLAPPPPTLEARQVVKIPYRITCLKPPGGDDSGGGCVLYTKCHPLWYIYKCSNGAVIEGIENFCTTQASGSDCGWNYTGATSGGGNAWWWWGWSDGGVDGGGGTGPGISSGSRPPAPVSGVVCGPKIYCELWDDCCKAKAREAVKSSVNLLMGEYNDEGSDLKLRVSGFNFEVRRSYYRNGWLHGLDELGIAVEPDGLGGIAGLRHGGVVYEPADDNGQVYALGDRRLTVTETGYRYADQADNWKDFDADGRLLRAGNRNGRYLDYTYDGEGLLDGVWSQTGEQVLWLIRENGRIVAIVDDAGRSVAYQYDAKGNLERFTNALGADTLYTYDADSRLLTKRLPTGKTFTIAYNAEGYVTSVVDETGAGKFFEYGYDASRGEYYAFIRTSAGEIVERWFDAEGMPVQRAVNGVPRDDLPAGVEPSDIVEKDPEGRITRVTHSDGTFRERAYGGPYGQVSRERNEAGAETRYAYDNRGNLTNRVEAWDTELAREIRYTYDDAGNRVDVRQLANANTAEAVVRYGYDADGNPVWTIDAEGHLFSNRFDRMGNPVETLDPCGAQWQIVYDALGNLVSKAGPGGYLESNVYDAVGQRVQAVNPLGRVMTFAYDGEGRLVSQTDPWARATTLAYDYDGRLVRQTDDEGRESGTDYDVEGHILRRWEQAGRITTYGYDAYGRLERVTMPDGRAATNVYDDAGHLTEARLPTFTQAIENDARGRPVAVVETGTDGTVRRSWRAYDALGRPVVSSNDLGEVTVQTYDLLGRRTVETQGGGLLAAYQYDGRDNAVRVTDGNGQTAEIAYDRNNRPVLKRFADGTCLHLAYDGCGRAKVYEDARGRQTRFDYDGLGRLVGRRYYASGDTNTPVRAVTFDYDLAGRPTGWNDGTFSGVRLYDEANRRVTDIVDYGPFSATNTFAFDASGRTTSIAGPQGETGYLYGQDGLLQAIDLGTAGSVALGDYQAERPRMIALPGGAEWRTVFGSFTVLTNRLVSPGGETLFMSVPTVAGGDRLTGLARTEGNYGFAYSAAQALTGEDLPPAVEAAGLSDHAYVYDAAGNLVETRATGVTNRFLCSVMNQATNVNGATLVYDAAGNLVARHDGPVPVFYAYDGDNRLTEVYDAASNVVARYRYDPQGRRLSKEAGGVTNYFLYGDQGLLAEFDGSGAFVRGYIYLPSPLFQGQPLAQRTPEGLFFFVNDHQGAPLMLVEGDGTAVWRAYRNAYGETVVDPDSVVACPLRFSSQYADDETGLHYNLNRYYDPALRRYLTRDPIGTAGGINVYAFAANNPAANTDPLGLEARRQGYKPDWQEMNCIKFKLAASIGAFAGVGAKFEATAYIQKCDCCEMNSVASSLRKWDKVEIGAEAALIIGVGLGAGANIAGFGFELSVTGPTISFGFGGYIAKACGDPWIDVTLKRSGKSELVLGLSGEAQSFAGVSIQMGYKLVNEWGFEMSLLKGLKAYGKVDQVTFYTWGASVGPVGVELPSESSTSIINESRQLLIF